MKIKYIYSACLEISTSNITILTDPWFTEGIYDGSWYHFPDIDPFEHISEPDYIYISHIHPDHYDPKFLHALFDRYGVKPILIPDLENNYLLFKGKFDGLDLTPTRYLDLGDLELYIEENNTGSISDIDSALIIHDKINQKNFLNLNDCIFNQTHVDKLKKIISRFSKKIDVIALGYTGAGPFPQTYFDLNNEKEILIERANIKKKQFFERYLQFTHTFPSTHHLPFAGEYILGGKLAKLNQYRGVADSFEVKEFDDRALVFNTGGCINLIDNNITNTRNQMHSQDDFNKKLNEIKVNKLDYEIDFNLTFDKINFLRLLKKASSNALRKSELQEKYYFIFSIKNNDITMKRFLCNCSNAEVNELNLQDEIKFEFYSEIIIDYRYLFGLLNSIYHWNNAEVGSLYFTKRHPIDNYNAQAYRFLNFFSIV